jgi:hypothetical protein
MMNPATHKATLLPIRKDSSYQYTSNFQRTNPLKLHNCPTTIQFSTYPLMHKVGVMKPGQPTATHEKTTNPSTIPGSMLIKSLEHRNLQLKEFPPSEIEC